MSSCTNDYTAIVITTPASNCRVRVKADNTMSVCDSNNNEYLLLLRYIRLLLTLSTSMAHDGSPLTLERVAAYDGSPLTLERGK